MTNRECSRGTHVVKVLQWIRPQIILDDLCNLQPKRNPALCEHPSLFDQQSTHIAHKTSPRTRPAIYPACDSSQILVETSDIMP